MEEFIITIPEFIVSFKTNDLKNKVFSVFFGNKYRIYQDQISWKPYGIVIYIENQKILVTEDIQYKNNNYSFILWVNSIGLFLHESLARKADKKRLKTIESFDIKNFQQEKIIRSSQRIKNINILNTSDDDSKGLREPQQCALHSIHTYWPDPNIKTQTIVLPTGTWKTETMLATVISKAVKTTLVIVPTDDLRTQIWSKFMNLWILRYLDICNNIIQNPTVCLLKNSPKTITETELIWSTSNIIISTVQLINNAWDEVKSHIINNTDLVIFDEAHHEWAEWRRKLSTLFKDKRILQFTATPYRNDKIELSGQITYNFSLKRAQELNLFSKIEFEKIARFDRKEADQEIALKAIKRLRLDIENHKDHILLARVNLTERAKEIFEYYKSQKDLNPIMIYNWVKDLEAKKESIKQKKHKIIIAVDMLSEWFDLPEIKIAALHDNHKSLPVFLQFIGRFTRNRSDLWEAYVIANVDTDRINESMSEIWNSKDWNKVISYVADEAVWEKLELQTFLEKFVGENNEFPLRSLKPKLSTLAYKVNNFTSFNMIELDDLLPGETVFEDSAWNNIYICIKKISWKIKRLSGNEVFKTNYNLYVFYYSEKLGILFVSGGDDKNINFSIIKHIVGPDVELLKDDKIFRVLSWIKRAVLTNRWIYPSTKAWIVSYEAQMWPQLNKSMDDFEKSVATKSNFWCYGYENDRKVTMACTRKWRFWSMDSSNIKIYIDWCERNGAKILDESIVEQDFLKWFLIGIIIDIWPEDAFPTTLDWTWESYEELIINEFVIKDGKEEPLYDFCFYIVNFDVTSGITFLFTNGIFNATFKYNLTDQGVSIAYIEGDKLYFREDPIEEYFKKWLRIWLDNFEYIEWSVYYKAFAKLENSVLNPDDIMTEEFQNIELNHESMGFGNDLREDSLQYYMFNKVKDQYSLIVNDDNSNELADLICITQENDIINVDLYHLKFAAKWEKSARIDNFHELMTQAQKTIRKISRKSAVFDHIKKRHIDKVRKYKVPRIIKGNEDTLNDLALIRNICTIKYRVFMVQPSITPKTLTSDIAIIIKNTINFLNTFGIETKLICSSDLE